MARKSATCFWQYPWRYTARASSHGFFKGKTVRIVVGLSPGGGFDTYAQAIGRHLGNHIPGNPTIIVENNDQKLRQA